MNIMKFIVTTLSMDPAKICFKCSHRDRRLPCRLVCPMNSVDWFKSLIQVYISKAKWSADHLVMVLVMCTIIRRSNKDFDEN